MLQSAARAISFEVGGLHKDRLVPQDLVEMVIIFREELKVTDD